MMLRTHSFTPLLGFPFCMWWCPPPKSEMRTETKTDTDSNPIWASQARIHERQKLCCRYQERWVEWKKTGGGSRRTLQRSSPARWYVRRDSLWLSKQNHRREIGPDQRKSIHHVCLHLHLNRAQSTYCLLNHGRNLNKPKFLSFLLYPGLGEKNCMTYELSNGAYVSYQ